MSLISITLIGLYNYDNSLFDDLVLPNGIDRNALIYLLLQRYGEFDLIYTSFPFMKESIKHWSLSHQVTFKKWLEGFKAEYNPIENYDRYEDIRDKGKNSNLSNTESNTLDKKSGYNNDVMVNDSSNKSDSKFNSNGEYDNTHSAHIHGNIGVTTAPKMLEEFFSLYGNNNLYSLICDLFADEYLIRLY